MKPTITIGIPAYNEDANIKMLLEDIISQNYSGLTLEKIIISSDGSTDYTNVIVKNLKIKKVELIENKDRKGIARGLNQIIKKTNSDVLILLDSDIRLLDKDVIKKLSLPLVNNRVDLTSSAIKDLPSKSFFSKVLSTSMMLKSEIFNSIKSGNNLYNCHGLARGFSKVFYKQFQFPFSVGNDMYSYLICIKKGLKFKYIKNAVVWYTLPKNFKDHKKQSLRFAITANKQEDLFNPTFVKSETAIPKKAYLSLIRGKFSLIAKTSGLIAAYVLVQLYLKFASKPESLRNETWDIAISSKKI